MKRDYRCRVTDSQCDAVTVIGAARPGPSVLRWSQRDHLGAALHILIRSEWGQGLMHVDKQGALMPPRESCTGSLRINMYNGVAP